MGHNTVLVLSPSWPLSALAVSTPSLGPRLCRHHQASASSGAGGRTGAARDGGPGCSSSMSVPVASPRESASAGRVDTSRPRRGQLGGACGPFCSAWMPAVGRGLQPRAAAGFRRGQCVCLEGGLSLALTAGAGPWPWRPSLAGGGVGRTRTLSLGLGRSICCTPWRSRANEGGWFGTESHEDVAASFGLVAAALLSDALGSLPPLRALSL